MPSLFGLHYSFVIRHSDFVIFPHMTPARFQTIEEIFLAALEQEPDQVSAFLDTACEGDAVLRREVEALLASDQRAGRFIETSSVGLATKVIQNQHADSLVGRTIGHYKISESIGTGGMGEVYLATDITAGRKAALKLLPLRFTGDAERLKRFQQEAHAVVGLNHPNILTVYEIGEDHSSNYIASELIEGETLRRRLVRGPMQQSEVIDVAIQVASALVAAHNAGIVHRDIKPENIMLRSDAYVKVLDFGIAKLAEQEVPVTVPRDEALLLVETNLGSILGTVRYMSPEQACGGHVDKRTDIWSLGVVLYEMLTGHAPFTGDTPQDVMFSILEKEPPPLTRYIARGPAELQQIISKTLRKDRCQRYDSAHELLQALKDLRRKLEADLERAAAPLWLRWARSPAALVFVLTIAALALALPFYRHRNLATSLPPDKSIAVLPFENLSDEKEHAAFADGVQDDILTKLAKIADLKVISQTSVMDYRGKRNLRQVGNDLGVSYVLEGSVRRSSTDLRLNAQLIDTRTDTHVWAQQYDRDLDDLFAIQSEIAQKVAERLNAKVTSAERLAIEEKPTTDLTAFELYSRAGDLLGADASKAIDLLNQAVARDPSFLKAYCLLVVAHDALYAFFDHTPARLALAEAAVGEASRIRPNAGETHWARAYHLYNGYRDYDGALAELEVARRSLPNDPYVFKLMGSIQRRQGRWEESIRNLERAVELDPRDVRILTQTGLSYGMFRRYAEQKSKLDRALTVAPNDVNVKADRAFVEVDWKADTGPLHQVIDEIRASNPAAVPQVADRWLLCTLAERDVTAAKDAFLASEFPLGDENVQFPRPFVEGVIARMAKDEHKAQLAFTAAREKQEKTVNAQPDYAPGWCVLGVIDAALGRKEEALREGRRAVELLPVGKDAINGLVMIKYLAMSAAWVGDKDLACEQLATAVRHPGGLSYGELKLMPWWDPLRGDPRFEKIVEESKQPIALELVEKNAPEKSIAVLPFENLSKDEENASFAGGVQDEILTNLAKVADLKVISRTSVMQYKSGPERNLREIAKALGVSHVVEGSVQRAGERVRVSAQLIDARNDTHLWAEHYDRDFADIFAVQNEIAQQIADQLQAKLSPAEKAAIAERPTADLVAYAYYRKANEINISDNWEGGEQSGKQKVELLEKATQRDPNFSLAYCALAKTQLDLSSGTEGPEDRKHLELAKKAAEAALRVRPDLGEAHLELARYYYYANLHTSNFDQALDELAIARRTLPNNSEAIMIGARIDKRQNRWDASLANFQKASELDPRNREVRWRLGQTYFQMRRYKEWEQVLTKDAGSGLPRDPWTQLLLAEIKLAQGDPVAAQSLLEQVPLDFSPSEQIWGIRFMAALYLRDYDAANRVIATTPAKFMDDAFDGPSGWAYGHVARARGDKQKALAVFAAARKKLDATWGDKPKDEEYFAKVAMVDAGLGRKEDAMREARRAVDLMPIGKDSQWGPRQVAHLALVYAWTGERDRALEQLEIVATIPGDAPTTYGDLCFNPCWDSLRGDKRFDKIIAAAKAASK
jgi:TolB-like protein/cytochrome c-type biogenesis protein CcmH/NrfG